MSPVVKVALGVTGVALGVAAAYAFFGPSSDSASGSTFTSGTAPNPASHGNAGVGYTSPGSGTRDWWHDRNARRRNKHMKLMTAKG